MNFNKGGLVKQLCDLMAVLASIFLGIAIIETVGKLFLGGFPQVPYLTANIASSIDYAWAYAVVLYGVRWGLQKMAGIEDDEQTEPSGIVEVEAASPPSTWACQCGRTNPADHFNCAACSAEQAPLSSSRWKT